LLRCNDFRWPDPEAPVISQGGPLIEVDLTRRAAGRSPALLSCAARGSQPATARRLSRRRDQTAVRDRGPDPRPFSSRAPYGPALASSGRLVDWLGRHRHCTHFSLD